MAHNLYELIIFLFQWHPEVSWRWLIPAYENQLCTIFPKSPFSDVMSVPISDLSHGGSIYTMEIGKHYKSQIFFFFQRASCQTYSSTLLDIFVMSLFFFCTLSFIFCLNTLISKGKHIITVDKQTIRSHHIEGTRKDRGT